jgi:uncharacterized protein
MIGEVTIRQADIERLCRRYGVHRLDVFGSAAAGSFRPAESDLDFLVGFETVGPGYADRFFGLLEGLQELFGRSVDLVVASSIRNPYFLESLERSKAPVYAA